MSEGQAPRPLARISVTAALGVAAKGGKAVVNPKTKRTEVHDAAGQRVGFLNGTDARDFTLSRENKNREGSEVKVGQVWQDCDERSKQAKRKVIEVSNGYARLDGPVKTWVAIRRMHPCLTGWKLVSESSSAR